MCDIRMFNSLTEKWKYYSWICDWTFKLIIDFMLDFNQTLKQLKKFDSNVKEYCIIQLWKDFKTLLWILYLNNE